MVSASNSINHHQRSFATMSNNKVTVIIPVYNEAGSIGNIVSEIFSLYPDFEVIVINDGSVDDTATEAENAGATVYSHPYNVGNGAAVKSGIRVASGDIVVFMDGDGQHNPQDIAALLKYLPDYDLVVGERSAADQASLGRAVGNKLYNWFASYVAKFSIKTLRRDFGRSNYQSPEIFYICCPIPTHIPPPSLWVF